MRTNDLGDLYCNHTFAWVRMYCVLYVCSIFPEMRYALLLSVRVRAARQRDVHVTYLAGVVFPSTSHPDSIRALRHPWLRLSRHQQGTS